MAGTTAPAASRVTRCLRVVWQDPATRQFHEVATLRIPCDGDGLYGFEYRRPLADAFVPFPAFPDVDRAYESPTLFPFFQNRIMSPLRPDYDDYLAALGLTRDEATPFEMLSRTGGVRATDTVQVVPEPVANDDGTTDQLFLASGVRHLPDHDELLASLRPGHELLLRDEPDNEFDSRAILLDAEAKRAVGWVPSYLLDEVHKFRDGRDPVRVFVERANGPDTPAHLRLLCRLRVGPTGS